MTPAQTLAKARYIFQDAGYQPIVPTLQNFGQYCGFVSDIIKNKWTYRRRTDCVWLPDFLESLVRLRDGFDRELARDPALGYVPMHEVALEFHKSQAKVRYWRGGNRTSKTQSGYLEDYWFATSQHPYRITGGFPAQVAIIAGLPLKEYAPKVFEKKMLEGEEANIISPLFPENGKWFYHHDPRRHVITLACPSCAEEGKAQRCPSHHPKAQISLISSEQGVGVLEAFQARFIHIDEHVEEEFYHASKMRTASVPNSAHIVTGTPLHGTEAWEQRLLAKIATGDPEKNRYRPDDPDSPPAVSLHEIDQFAAGIIPHDEIRNNMRDMDEFEIESRVYGRPAPLAKNPVFDRAQLAEMRNRCTTPRFGQLLLDPTGTQNPDDLSLETCIFPAEIKVEYCTVRTPEEWTGLRVWEEPVPNASYVAVVDTARGLAGRDASCCSVAKVYMNGSHPKMEVVAQFYGWLGIIDYAEECKKLAVWYNTAMLVVELTGGLGASVVEQLRKKLYYPNIFRDTSRPELAEVGMDARFGIDTNMYTKPMMVGALQHAIRYGWIDIPCKDSIGELVAFEQERSQTGKTTTYRGAGGSRDDRAMSLVMMAYVCMTYPVLDFQEEYAIGLREDMEAEVEKETYDPNELLGLTSQEVF